MIVPGFHTFLEILGLGLCFLPTLFYPSLLCCLEDFCIFEGLSASNLIQIYLLRESSEGVFLLAKSVAW